MRYGYWLPVFGGWLRNVEDEGMVASWEYVKRLAQRSEEIGYDITLVAELLLNDIKGIEAPSLDAWSTAAALAAVTERLEIMVAVRPSFHPPAILAKQAANIDRISNGRLALNVVSAWWKDEARRYGAAFDEHDDRYARTSEWLDVVDGAWHQASFDYKGKYYRAEELILEPKPVATRARHRRPRPTIYAGGESEAAKSLIARKCDAFEGQAESRFVGLVRPSLLGGDDPVELHAEPHVRGGEQVVVAVGDDTESEPFLQPRQGGRRIGERRPVRDGARKRDRFRRGGLRSELGKDAPQDSHQHLPV